MVSLDNYSRSYDDLLVHQLMLQDEERVESYKEAFENNKHLLKGKVVLDVGCGTGILSLLAARSGAEKVYSVDGSKVSLLAKKIVEDNDLSDKIQIIHGFIEEVELPVQKVDIIVSEWMGFYLLHEGMLDSVIFARDKWLDPSAGVMFPCKASIYASLVELEDFWVENIESLNNIQGFNYSSMKELVLAGYLKSPLILDVEPKNVDNFTSDKLFEIDLYKVKTRDLDDLQTFFNITVKKDTEFVNGFILWFDVVFPGKDDGSKVLSTSPYGKSTHWKQTITLFKDHLEAKKGLNLKCHAHFYREKDTSKRNYTILIEVADAFMQQ
ncbi:hypothetical protein FG386_001979 [Cryptosporidium ryanae]|uniref:uncharacterized protein n=1 Tax=Cryptosporidium ryanae TaxID=515981 RepID=UPI00351A48AC|nr:hypothetical protein FG386_001979 [Cryptosporidium ryanae]